MSMMQLGLGLGLGGGGGGNPVPTDISLSVVTVAEDAELGVVVGTLTADDPGDVVTFSLVDDAGGLFGISGSNLIVTGVLDYEAATSHNITVRATDSAGGFYDETFMIAVTDVAEMPPAEPPPDGEIIDDGTFINGPYITDAAGSVKLSGKKAAGSTGKFIYNIGPFAADTTYTMRYDPDFSLLAQQGKLAMVGFGIKSGNNFRLSGLRGDGSSSLNAYEVSGTNWNESTGHTINDGGAATNGTQAGPNWLQIQVATDGSTYTLRTSDDGENWDDEFTDVTPSPFTNTTDATQAGIAVYLNGADAGSFSVAITLWISAQQFRGAIVKNAGDSGSTNFTFTTLLTFDSEDIDTDGTHSTSSNTSRITIPSALNGRYGIIHASVRLTSMASGNSWAGEIRKGGTRVFMGSGIINYSNATLTEAFMSFQTQPVVLATNDIFEVAIYSSDTSTVLENNSSFTLQIVG